MPVSENMLRSGSMMRGTLPVAHTQGSVGNRAGNFSSNRTATANSEHFFSRSGATPAGRAGGNTQSLGARSNSMATGRTGTGTTGARGSTYSWQRYSTPGRTPAAGGGSSMGSQGRSAPTTGGSPSWQRYASPNPYSSGRQGYNSQSRSNYGAGSTGRSGGSYYGGGSRPPLQLNRPIMRQRAPSGYYGGGRRYSAPSGGSHNYSAPKGGGHSYSAPKSSGGGGGGHSSGGGHGGGKR